MFLTSAQSRRTCIVSVFLLLLIGTTTLRGQSSPSLKWKVQRLAVDANEGVDIADFNRDGKLDIAAGRNWYAAPDFSSRPLRHIEDWNGYVESNGDYAYDVDKDGFTDIIATRANGGSIGLRFEYQGAFGGNIC